MHSVSALVTLFAIKEETFKEKDRMPEKIITAGAYFLNRVMEIIGKGDYELGAVWVARKVPEGYISG
jgi:hypothetical protein